MLLMKKVLLRNCILFFFWFMVNAVFEVLEITALGREDVLAYRNLIQIVYIIDTAVICLALAAGIRHGFKNIFRFRKEEWLYIGVNGLAFFIVLSSLKIVFVLLNQGGSNLPVILWSLLGIAAAAGAAAADLIVFAPLHRRLRRTSPHMMYVFSAALLFACMLFPFVHGLSYAGPLFTVLMIVYLAFYMLGRMYRKTAEDEEQSTAEQISREVSAAVPIRHNEAQVKVVREYIKTDDSQMLTQNPHFICNTLNTINYQIDHNPVNAKKTVSSLADYMQGKYSGLKCDHMIPFETEIKTVNSYLDIQKLRFEDQLNIITDYKATGFFVPALTVTAVIEHIMTNILLHRSGQGTVRIETAASQNANHITIICDDNINDADSLRHICEAFPLLKTMKERLDRFCGGTFEAVRDGSKTVFRIEVPIRQETDDSEGVSPASSDAV